ncbi:entericidin EcnA/B family protein [Sagittula sp. NFXS13]|uniref:Putative small secreted protein n=1 Tax=Sagittula marina TaxID=943940 RepID=A0A7W6DLB4_9RHOB|nr:entericidin EcnA/B family protein [Sagittula marina]MBB3985330.1 putative small secreted protein [Sagittula marina]
MKKILIVMMALALASCGTVDGIGQDISAGSRTVQSWL